MGLKGRSCVNFVLAFCLLFAFLAFQHASGQGPPQSTYSGPSVVRGALDLAPSNPLATPTGMGAPGMDSIPLTPQMFRGILPLPANLQAGYLYSFGESVASGRLTLDLVQPVVLGNSAVFGEAHTAFQDFWKTVTLGADNRVDLSLGGGYRTLLNSNTLLGVNGFFDSTRLGSRWYSSGSVGFEMAALIAGSDAIDLSFNWYGNLFNSNVLANAFRRGPENYDFEAGYSHELWNGGPDLRLFATGYRFSAGSGVYGIRGGAELKSRNGMFSLKYEAANDRINNTYHTVGGFVNVGIQLANLLNGASPFVMPEPIFKSPRNLLSRLTRPARRSSSQPVAIIVSRSGTLPTELGGLNALFTRTSIFGVIGGNTVTSRDLNQTITETDLANVTSVIITWSGPAAPQDEFLFALLQEVGALPCVGPYEDINGATSPPGYQTSDPAFWTLCHPPDPWNRVQVKNSGTNALTFGTVTLSFY